MRGHFIWTLFVFRKLHKNRVRFLYFTFLYSKDKKVNWGGQNRGNHPVRCNLEVISVKVALPNFYLIYRINFSHIFGLTHKNIKTRTKHFTSLLVADIFYIF